eukprot:181967-Chlamydomonas_euryale.AAC.1
MDIHTPASTVRCSHLGRELPWDHARPHLGVHTCVMSTSGFIDVHTIALHTRSSTSRRLAMVSWWPARCGHGRCVGCRIAVSVKVEMVAAVAGEKCDMQQPAVRHAPPCTQAPCAMH